jgi:hypothetical protein
MTLIPLCSSSSRYALLDSAQMTICLYDPMLSVRPLRVRCCEREGDGGALSDRCGGRVGFGENYALYGTSLFLLCASCCLCVSAVRCLPLPLPLFVHLLPPVDRRRTVTHHACHTAKQSATNSSNKQQRYESNSNVRSRSNKLRAH